MLVSWFLFLSLIFHFVFFVAPSWNFFLTGASFIHIFILQVCQTEVIIIGGFASLSWIFKLGVWYLEERQEPFRSCFSPRLSGSVVLVVGLGLVRCLHVSPWWDGHSTWCQWTESNSASKCRGANRCKKTTREKDCTPKVGGASAMLFASRSSVLFSDVKDSSPKSFH